MFKHVEDIACFFSNQSPREIFANVARSVADVRPTGFTLVANGGPEPLTAGTIGGLACELSPAFRRNGATFYKVMIHYDSPIKDVS